MKSQKKKVKLAELVEDFGIYPRTTVDATHVAHIAEAIESGSELPPIIADSKSLRIIDGLHRRRALKRLYGDDVQIEIEVRTYESDTEMLLDAMRLNASHGKNMCPNDRTHAILLASRLGADEKDVAVALNITVARVDEIKQTLTIRVEGQRARVPMKFAIRHMEGQQLTPKQAQVNEKLGGNKPLFLVNQLIMLIENDLIDLEDQNLINGLNRLAEAITKLKGPA